MPGQVYDKKQTPLEFKAIPIYYEIEGKSGKLINPWVFQGQNITNIDPCRWLFYAKTLS